MVATLTAEADPTFHTAMGEETQPHSVILKTCSAPKQTNKTWCFLVQQNQEHSKVCTNQPMTVRSPLSIAQHSIFRFKELNGNIFFSEMPHNVLFVSVSVSAAAAACTTTTKYVWASSPSLWTSSFSSSSASSLLYPPTPPPHPPVFRKQKNLRQAATRAALSQLYHYPRN